MSILKPPLVHTMEQGTPEWFEIRTGVPSSSNFSRIITSTGEKSKSLFKYAFELATEKFIGCKIDDGFKGNKYTERGIILEPEAISAYQMEEQVNVSNVGFITDYLSRWGTSTDGLVNDDGVVEFKNLTTLVFMQLYLDLKKTSKLPSIHAHKQQVQGELFITQRKWVDLVFYNPAFDIIIIRFEPDLNYHKFLENGLKECIAERNRIIKIARSN